MRQQRIYEFYRPMCLYRSIVRVAALNQREAITDFAERYEISERQARKLLIGRA